MGASHADFFDGAGREPEDTSSEDYRPEPKIEDLIPDYGFGDNFTHEDDIADVTQRDGWNTGARIDRGRTDRAIKHFMVDGQKVPFNGEKMYEDWRKSKGDATISPWKNLPDTNRFEWQTEHPEGKALMAAAHKKARVGGPSTFDSDFTSHQISARKFEQSRAAGVHLFGDPEAGRKFLETKKLTNIDDAQDNTPELDYHKAWFAPITSKPEIGWAPHSDSSSFEGLHNLIHQTVQTHLGAPLESIPDESRVGQHAKAALNSLATAAMHHSLGDLKNAKSSMSGTLGHVNKMLTTIKGAQANSGQAVSAAPDPAHAEAARYVSQYESSLSGRGTGAAASGTGQADAMRSNRISKIERL